MATDRPDFERERALSALRRGAVCGVDEVGRGPLAGPVVAAAVLLSQHAADDLAAGGLTDSKRLTATARERLAASLRQAAARGEARLGVGAASVREIEALNIRGATHAAMRRAVSALRRGGATPAAALVDGRDAPADLAAHVEAVVGGDSRCLSIAAASVVAKTLRDALMRALARRWPGYGWERNAGYASAAHRAAIKSLGPTPHHRPRFCRNVLAERAR